MLGMVCFFCSNQHQQPAPAPRSKTKKDGRRQRGVNHPRHPARFTQSRCQQPNPGSTGGTEPVPTRAIHFAKLKFSTQNYGTKKRWGVSLDPRKELCLIVAHLHLLKKPHETVAEELTVVVAQHVRAPCTISERRTPRSEHPSHTVGNTVRPRCQRCDPWGV